MKIVDYFTRKSEVWKKILKCVIAYEIAIILVLIPQFDKIAGNPPYLVPLGTIFFNAAGTAGNQIVGMILNTIMMIVPAIWVAIFSYCCTAYNTALLTNPHLYANGAGIIAAIAFAFCVFVTAYLRLKYPRLYIPALQGFTLPFFGLTRNIYDTQFHIMNIVATTYPVLIGGAIALVVNLVLWPETAAKAFEKSFGNSIESVKDILSFVHEDLLKNDDSRVMTGDISASAKLQTLNNKLQKDIGSMKFARKDAKYEIIVSYHSQESYKPLVHSISDLAQDMLGFSLAIKREVRIILEKKVKAHLEKLKSQSYHQQQQHQASLRTVNSSYSSQGLSTSTPIPTVEETQLQASVLSGDTLLHGREYRSIDRLQSSIQPDVKRFISTCIFALDQIECSLVENKAIIAPLYNKPTKKSHSSSKINLQRAIEDFKEAEIRLQQEYDQTNNAPQEDHFLVFTIIFTLVEFGKQLINLQNQAEMLIKDSGGPVSKKWYERKVFFPHVPLLRWLSKGTDHDHKGGQSLSEKVVLDNRELQLKETANVVGSSVAEPSSSNGATTKRRKKSSRTLNNDDISDGESEDDSLHLQQKISRIATRLESNPNELEQKYGQDETIKYRSQQVRDEEYDRIPLQNMPGSHFYNKVLYKLVKWFQYGPTRYAIKFTITAELLALMAFLPIQGANDFYNNNHGQWALLSMMVVFNYTVGSTALQCFYRIVATILGAVCAYISLLAAHQNENPYVLAVMILIFQIPFWYLLLDNKYPRIGFISLLTMGVVSCTGYMNTLDEPIFVLVWKRTLTAIFAILLVMIVDQCIWPVWARKRLRICLAELLIATGIQYARAVSLVCQENTHSYRYRITLDECKKNQKVLTQQLHVVHEMLVLAADEPRLTKGPFPMKEYTDILEHERNILHWIAHIQKSQALITEGVRVTLMNPMNSYRKEMAATVHLYLFTLACSLQTKSALPASLPSAETARQMLQQKQTMGWRENYERLCLISSKNVANKQQAEYQMFWHTYAAGSTEVVVEQEAMGMLVARLMGQHVFKASMRDWDKASVPQQHLED